jgi:DMSO/TMAO reductase YedYZ heme-binding membrane subunit
MTDRTVRLVLKPLVFTAAVAPAASIVWMLATRRFDAISFNAIVRSTGFWSLRFLCLTIAITPLRWLTGWHAAIRVRRMLGLFACFYGAVHLGAYVVFDCLQGVELTAVAPTLSAVAGDLPRPFFAMGYISFALMVPLAATSTAAMIRRLGGAPSPRLCGGGRGRRAHVLAVARPFAALRRRARGAVCSADCTRICASVQPVLRQSRHSHVRKGMRLIPERALRRSVESHFAPGAAHS